MLEVLNLILRSQIHHRVQLQITKNVLSFWVTVMLVSTANLNKQIEQFRALQFFTGATSSDLAYIPYLRYKKDATKE